MGDGAHEVEAPAPATEVASGAPAAPVARGFGAGQLALLQRSGGNRATAATLMRAPPTAPPTPIGTQTRNVKASGASVRVQVTTGPIRTSARSR